MSVAQCPVHVPGIGLGASLREDCQLTFSMNGRTMKASYESISFLQYSGFDIILIT
jgi:hypothetical protein